MAATEVDVETKVAILQAHLASLDRTVKVLDELETDGVGSWYERLLKIPFKFFGELDGAAFSKSLVLQPQYCLGHYFYSETLSRHSDGSGGLSALRVSIVAMRARYSRELATFQQQALPASMKTFPV